MIRGNQAEKEQWFLLWPDREEDRSGSLLEEAMAEISARASECGITLFWTPQSRDTGFGLERKAILRGREEDLEIYLNIEGGG